MRSVELPHGVATSIGSLPHTDPRAAAGFVLARHARLPAAPSLPARSGTERMVAQAAWGIRGITVHPDGSLELNPGLLDGSLDAGIGGEPFVSLRAFLAAVAGRRGPIKLQLTGPATLGVVLSSLGVPVAQAVEIAGRAVRARARVLLAAAREAAPMAPLVVFLDEPSLSALTTPGFPLGAEAALDLVSGALATLEAHVATGLHCCGSADWRLLLQAGPQILSLPVGAGATAHAGAIGAFLERGGWVAWGAVPTGRPIGTTASRLWRSLSSEWCSLVQGGCHPVLLREQSLITPACGLAGHDEPQAAQILSLTNQLSRRVGTQALGLRLTVGA